MALDRETTLRKAEKLLRQGRLDAAIAEYVKVVEDHPHDWTSANALGDLYARGGQTDKAVAQYSRIAEHLSREGFYPKAAALLKKILKVNREDEAAQLRLAEVSALQGLMADAKAHFTAVAGRRRARGDLRGEAEIIVRLAGLDPSDAEARLNAARTLEDMGRTEEAAGCYQALYDDLSERGRSAEALQALREFLRLRPSDAAARGRIARAALDSGDIDAARSFLDSETAGSDPELLLALADVSIRSGNVAAARELFPRILATGGDAREKLTELGWAVFPQDSAASFACISAAVDAAVSAAEFGDAAALLQRFVDNEPGHVPSLLRLVEVCVDGGLEAAMYAAQERLTDAYLERGQAAEARVIAEDLVAREPWVQTHIDRFRRALVMLRVSDPDGEIAERLSGQSPFTATDPFIDLTDLPDPGRSGGAAAQPIAGPEIPEAPASPLEQRSETAPDPVPRPPAAVHAGEIDLTSVLGSLDGDAAGPPPRHLQEGEPPMLEDVFRQLRETSGSDADYSAQHMTLARTYLEMGMADEAAGALKAAAASPRGRFDAASMLGRLLLARGDRDEALHWLERAAEAPPPNPEAGWALFYDFGVALDDAGETHRALAVFLELQADAGDYRDVPARIDRLTRVQTGG